MTPEEARANIGKLVRCKNKDSSRNCGRGWLRGVRGKKAIIQPFYHRTESVLPLSAIRLWKSGNAAAAQRTEARRTK